jgi:hypothetical protein
MSLVYCTERTYKHRDRDMPELHEPRDIKGKIRMNCHKDLLSILSSWLSALPEVQMVTTTEITKYALLNYKARRGLMM